MGDYGDVPLESVSEKVRINERPLRSEFSAKGRKKSGKSNSAKPRGSNGDVADSEGEEGGEIFSRYSQPQTVTFRDDRKIHGQKDPSETGPNFNPTHRRSSLKTKPKSGKRGKGEEGETGRGARIGRSTRILQHILRHLPYAALIRASRVNTLWRKIAKTEKSRRDALLEVDCIVFELRRPDEVDHDRDITGTDLNIELKYRFNTHWAQPHYIISFLTQHIVTDAFQELVKHMPEDCLSTIVGSEDGIVGTDRKGFSDLYDKENQEAISSLYIPKYNAVQIVPFSAKSFQDLSLKEFFFDNIGITNYEQKKLVKCILLFPSSSRADFDDPCYVKESLLRDLRKDFSESFYVQTCIAGATVAFSQHSGSISEADKAKSTFKAENRIKGIVFAGKDIEVKCSVFERLNIDEDRMEAKMQDLAVFYRSTHNDKLAFMLVGTAADYDKGILKEFKKKFPFIPIIGTRTTGSVFGSGFNSESLSDRSDADGNDIQVGDLVVIVAMKIHRYVKVKKNTNTNGLRYYRLK